MEIKGKELQKIGYIDHVAKSLAIEIVKKYCKHDSKNEVIHVLKNVLFNPDGYKDSPVWYKLAERLSPTEVEKIFKVYDLRSDPIPYKTYGKGYIENIAIEQMDLAMRLPVSCSGALMPDAHAGYGLPIGGVLAVENAVIPYAVGLDIGCRMNMTIFDAPMNFINRYSFHIKETLKYYTHFGMDGTLPFRLEHEVLEHPSFKQINFLKQLHGKAARQLGTSGSGNHFVEFGEVELLENNALGLPVGNYIALLSHSGSRGLGANIAKYYSGIAQDVCKLPRQAQHFAWLDLNSEAGREYWECMTLAGAYAKACHEKIHENLSKALDLKPLKSFGNHHNFAWEEMVNGRSCIVHRKGATPANQETVGIIPGSMASHGYIVSGKGVPESLFSASHGAGRAMSRQKAKNNFTASALKKYLNSKGVTLIGGSVEEMPLAYKDIERIMNVQKDLVRVDGKFMPKIVRMNKE